MADEIIRELWKIKDEIASEHGYDLDALSAYLRSRTYSGHQLITDLQAVKVPAEQAALNEDTTRLYHHQ